MIAAVSRLAGFLGGAVLAGYGEGPRVVVAVSRLAGLLRLRSRLATATGRLGLTLPPGWRSTRPAERQSKIFESFLECCLILWITAGQRPALSVGSG